MKLGAGSTCVQLFLQAAPVFKPKLLYSLNRSLNLTQFDRGYTGHEHMCGFGLINMNGRLYDPYLQRFLSPDQFIQDATDAQNYNRYTYCLNNPLMYSDPTGWQYLAAIETYINPFFDRFMREATGRGGGCSGSSGFGVNCFETYATALGLLRASEYGGTWSSNSGIHYFYNGDEAINAGCNYNDYHNSWSNTEAKNRGNAMGAFRMGLTAEAYRKVRTMTASLNGGIAPSSAEDGLWKIGEITYASEAALKQYIAIVVGESANNMYSAAGIGSVMMNRLAFVGATLNGDFVSKIGGTGQFNAIGGPDYNAIMNSTWESIFDPNNEYATRISGALMPLVWNKDYSNGAYFWNRSSPRVGPIWGWYNDGTFGVTANIGGTTFFRYVNPNKTWP